MTDMRTITREDRKTSTPTGGISDFFVTFGVPIGKNFGHTVFIMKQFSPFAFLFWLLIGSFGASQAYGESNFKVTPPPEMILPVDCEVGWNCWIANYVDHDAKEDEKDYRCGEQTYDGHKGTDFMIRNKRAMIDGVIVRAVADGTVVGTRDGMRDIDYRKRDPELIRNKECGNGVRIDHGKGWMTQYCHLRKNSLKLTKGDQVKAGDILGFVGNSGKTFYPHLHFQVEYVPEGSGRRRGHIVDPFVGLARDDLCQGGDDPLWPVFLIDKLPYSELSIIDTGFSASQPKQSALIEGLYNEDALSIRSPMLFLWARMLHVKKGDRVTFTIVDPDGDEVLSYSSEIDKDQAYRSLHSGVRRPTLNWDPGLYKGLIKLVRTGDGEGKIFRKQTSIVLR